jgi:hypothetical protein
VIAFKTELYYVRLILEPKNIRQHLIA